MSVSPLAFAHAPVRRWFAESFSQATPAQALGWAAIARGESTLLLAPTGSGKTLAAFLAAIDRLMFSPEPAPLERLRVLYVSPLRALAVDVERNLARPLGGIRACAEADGFPHRALRTAVRSGDTPASERARLGRQPPDILITTPESLYLLLTSSRRRILSTVDTVIIDEIHSLVPTKRGAHLFLSLERLEELRGGQPLQRIGLSATQRPQGEAARLLGGGTLGPGGAFTPRPVTIVDAGARRELELTVEVPVEDMTSLPAPPASAEGQLAGPRSIWPAIHPRLVELIRAHRSTMVFVNSRRLAERLAAALNDAAGEEIALAHHGSIARETRRAIELRLKGGTLPAIVATSSLELGIDMGAVDLVLQIESPPSVAAGLQRIGRANHQVGQRPRGRVFPKFRGDLLAAAAAAAGMLAGQVEATHYPRSPLDVLAQQIVAEVAVAPTTAAALYDLVRRAAPFAELPRGAFLGVLDLLAGRYAASDFADLRPRLIWDRPSDRLEARHGARAVAVLSGGTIPERGLFGAFLVDDHDGAARRVGELDEEMVFESRIGDVFLLGASSWRIEEITHDRVLVSPAPGEPGKMPFWRGDRQGRPAELGRAIGELARTLVELPAAAATERLTTVHHLDGGAARNLVEYLQRQLAEAGAVPSDRTVVLERFVDEIGDFRVCLLSPFGARVHAPWAMAVRRQLRSDGDAEIDVTWSDDGIVFRLPGAAKPPAAERFFPSPLEVEALVVRELDQTALFAARFRENAGRALLLTRRGPGRRQPLWALRRRSASLLAVASRFPDFPIVLETFRECLRDVFDLPALVEILRQVEDRRLTVATVDSRRASPFASALLFNYVANFMYDGDAPAAERRAQALALDHEQLRALLGEAELRTLLDPAILVAHERRLQHLDERLRVRHRDGLHDLLLLLGDLDEQEIAQRCEAEGAAKAWLGELLGTRRVRAVTIAGQARFIAVEDSGRYRDALGLEPEAGTPEAFLDPRPRALHELCLRWARTHGPFRGETLARRLGVGVAPVAGALADLVLLGQLVEGAFLPGESGRDFVDPEVLLALKRQSLARLRREVEPVDQAVLGRFLPAWHGLAQPRRGLDALLSVIELLQGLPLPASTLEEEILPARLADYSPGALDELCVAGEVVWRGREPLGADDGRVALYLTDQAPLLAPPPSPVDGALAAQVVERLGRHGALFFADLQSDLAAFPPDLLAALLGLLFAGVVTNDTLAPLRSLRRGRELEARSRPGRGRPFRSRRAVLPGSEGRWSLCPAPSGSETERRAALARLLLERHGVLTKEAALAEGLRGGFASIYPVLKAMEEAGRVRRGYFIAGRGALQFALPGAEDRLRLGRDPGDDPSPLVLAATDPANPYGAALPWPELPGRRPQRAAGAQVILCRGELVAFLSRAHAAVDTFLSPLELAGSEAGAAIAAGLRALVGRRGEALLVEAIDGAPAAASPLAPRLVEQGFRPSSRGYLLLPWSRP